MVLTADDHRMVYAYRIAVDDEGNDPGVGRYFITAANNHYLVQWHNQFTENVPIDKERVQRKDG
ncbi:hypothetical protein ASPCAL03382 [Aspergillus calidoustus]|uniref:Uncharacterized protein n=1 Tax=Aspergillus calidoustus TaxID=454130 RepID=A0A0U5FRQ4_ASPCI|nr:hypothetical protein ASPCAL03382 [Aspergillus calidoustus]